jgi:peptide alpha-N-acetyltransferase
VCQLADEARQMDLSDRYLNSECTLHMLDADMVTKAQETISLFTKDGDNGDNLHEMQCIWYETAAGNSHLRTEQYGKALRQLLAVRIAAPRGVIQLSHTTP